MEKLTHGSLFSGIGGFELGAKMSGIDTVWSCEIEKYNREILKKHFPNTKQYEDIIQVKNVDYVDIISGGFPCQDISIAGKMEGITGSRSGLWSEMFRIIRMVRPRYTIIENSPALLIRGFEKVLCDLSSIGYDAEWQVISNNAFGYPHKRERIYIIAYSDQVRQQKNLQNKGNFTSIFKQWTSSKHSGYSLSERIYKIRESENIRNGNGFQNWTHRVGSIGNAVNPTITHYLFECIKIFNHNLKS